jgi:hypothetical protein
MSHRRGPPSPSIRYGVRTAHLLRSSNQSLIPCSCKASALSSLPERRRQMNKPLAALPLNLFVPVPLPGSLRCLTVGRCNRTTLQDRKCSPLDLYQTTRRHLRRPGAHNYRLSCCNCWGMHVCADGLQWRHSGVIRCARSRYWRTWASPIPRP